MKFKFFIPLLASIFIVILLWLCISFSEIDLNPFRWDKVVRDTLSVIGFFSLLMGMIITFFYGLYSRMNGSKTELNEQPK